MQVRGALDMGIGMNPAEMVDLFEPFYRVPSSEPAGPSGTGLGLAICKRIAQANGQRYRGPESVPQVRLDVYSIDSSGIAEASSRPSPQRRRNVRSRPPPAATGGSPSAAARSPPGGRRR